MAVLRSRRRTSACEYENTLARLYEYSRRKTSAVSKRRQKWLCQEIDSIMNEVYFNIMGISTDYIADKEERSKHSADIATTAADKLMSLQKPLIVLWNVQKFETKRMEEWASMIERECILLNGLAQRKEVGDFMILNWHTIGSVSFLNNMSKLHRYTHGKVVNGSKAFDNTHGRLLIKEVDDALYYLLLANKSVPKTKGQYEARRAFISKAISCLKRMNRNMLFYFNLMEYSERIMNEWSDMLAQELKMLQALQKSDKSRFANLEE